MLISTIISIPMNYSLLQIKGFASEIALEKQTVCWWGCKCQTS